MTDQSWARAEDARDPLRALQARFARPRGPDGQPLLYLCGHSLGLAPLAARECIAAEIGDWERLGVLGHEEARSPWIGYADQFQAPLARLCGARPVEVVAMNSLSINLHMLLAGFYRPTAQRSAVLISTVELLNSTCTTLGRVFGLQRHCTSVAAKAMVRVSTRLNCVSAIRMNTKFTEMVPCSPGSRTFIVEAMHANERQAR